VVIPRRCNQVCCVALLLCATACSTGAGTQSTPTTRTPQGVGTSTTTTPTTVPSGAARRAGVVRYHGVQVQVPPSWPLVDGMHTAQCGSPFSQTATAYVGPNDFGPPSCPSPGLVVGFDGVWLRPSPRPADAGRFVLTASGVVVFAEDGLANWPVKRYWLHGVEVNVGIGPDRRVGEAIVASIRLVAGAPDTPAAQACGRRSGGTRMPIPERLTRAIVSEHGDTVLAPPKAADRPIETAAQAWAHYTVNVVSFERYRLILARYSSKLGGLERPFLAWIVYATPVTAIPGCGFLGAYVDDAITGHGAVSGTFGP